jgi:hypothetical protein
MQSNKDTIPNICSQSQFAHHIEDGKRSDELIEYPNKKQSNPKMIDENWISINYNNLVVSM